MQEVFTLKEKLLLTAAAALLVSGGAISWGCPEIFSGWSLPAICGAWLVLGSAVFGAAVSVGTAVRVAWDCHCDAIRRKEREEIAQIIGRDGVYISRDAVCRTAETFGRGR